MHMNQKKQYIDMWKKILLYLQESNAIKRSDILTFFKTTTIIDIKDDVIIFGSSSEFYQTNIQKKFGKVLYEACKEFLPDTKEIECIVDGSLHLKDERLVNVVSLDKKQKKPKHIGMVEGVSAKIIHSEYTFENFVVGSESQLAYAAAQAVVKKPGKTYNPLFIYGDIGLGKTHLLQAIANEILHKDSKKIVVYAPSEKFIHEIITGIRTGKADAIRKKYRKIDVLIIDDIQFLARKEATQTEFFHLFNSLISEQKQIVLAADKPPSELADLEPRLKTRFSMGMSVDVSSPDVETKMAILQQACHQKCVLLPTDIIEFIALNIQDNVRELMGMLNHVIALQELTEIMPDLATVTKIFRKHYPQKKLLGLSEEENLLSITFQEIIETVSSISKVSKEDILGTSRKKEIVLMRQISMLFCKKVLIMTLEQIGEQFGGKDHSTVFHSIDKIQHKIENDIKIEAIVRDMSSKIGIEKKVFEK
jgi:chromosomal replication initiator protein